MGDQPGARAESIRADDRSARPYRVLAVSVYKVEADIADRLTKILQVAGWPRANRSLVIREALLRLNEDLADKTSDEVLRYFVDRQSRRLREADTHSDAE